jgi:hypothetical protein
MSMAMYSLIVSIVFLRISADLAVTWRYSGGSFSVALLRSGYQTPFVLTEPPASSRIYV